ncbi:RNA polymerase sigma factor [Nannocystis pusilla]|uniref:RNA polymerase sigma factor n=1 Tax=Nannocystis pusilla TaxID=889268 RepID=UPI003B82977E
MTDLQAFLGELDPDRWAVFVLSEIEGLRGTEIAAELGVNLSTVYARLRVAKAGFERTMARRRGERRGRGFGCRCSASRRSAAAWRSRPRWRCSGC